MQWGDQVVSGLDWQLVQIPNSRNVCSKRISSQLICNAFSDHKLLVGRRGGKGEGWSHFLYAETKEMKLLIHHTQSGLRAR